MQMCKYLPKVTTVLNINKNTKEDIYIIFSELFDLFNRVNFSVTYILTITSGQTTQNKNAYNGKKMFCTNSYRKVIMTYTK